MTEPAAHPTDTTPESTEPILWQLACIGLGAVVAAGRGARRLADVLADSSPGIDEKGRQLASAAAWRLGAAVGSTVESAQELARTSAQQVQEFRAATEQAFEAAMRAAMRRVGIPTADEIYALRDRLDQISSTLDSLKAITEPLPEPTRAKARPVRRATGRGRRAPTEPAAAPSATRRRTSRVPASNRRKR